MKDLDWVALEHFFGILTFCLAKPLMPTSTVEDYLKSILRLDEDGSRSITVGGIAEDLGVTPGTVSSMMRTLSDDGLVEYVPRRSITLLPEGRQQALRVVRRHRLIESFLVEVMQLDWSEVHEEAEILEHVISDRLLQRMDEMLGHPSHDPHGDPIPDASGVIADQETQELSEAAPGDYYRVVRVCSSDPRFLDWLRDHGLQPGCKFQLSRKDEIAGLIEVTLSPKAQPIPLSQTIAQTLLVEPAA